jgi:hypothetical protein
LISRIRQLSEENLDGHAIVSKARADENIPYFRNYNQAIVNIELGLETEMKNLTRDYS